MLVDSANESAVRLPQSLSKMDIKDLLGSDNKPQHLLPIDRRPSAYDKVPSSPRSSSYSAYSAPHFPPFTSTAQPLLPSPAASIPPDPHRRRSTPFPVKSESQSIHPHQRWSRYEAHPHSHQHPPPPPPPPPQHHPPPYPYPPPYHAYDTYSYPHSYPGYSPHKRSSSLDADTDPNSAKRQKKGKGPNQKWDAEEDARIIELRGSGMKWGEISKKLPGRTEIACRLHYQNYLEKRGQWDEEKKTKLARVYDRMKADMWQPLATELGVPWRSAEAMHWTLGEREMARRANTVPFALVCGANPAGPQGEGNGRIAQANRMHEATIYFGEGDLDVLKSPETRTGEEMSLGVDGGDDEVARREILFDRELSPGGHERVNGAYDSSNVSPTTVPSDDFRRDRLSIATPSSEEAIRLPPLKNLQPNLGTAARIPADSNPFLPAPNLTPERGSHSGGEPNRNSHGSSVGIGDQGLDVAVAGRAEEANASSADRHSPTGSERLLALADASYQRSEAQPAPTADSDLQPSGSNEGQPSPRSLRNSSSGVPADENNGVNIT